MPKVINDSPTSLSQRHSSYPMSIPIKGSPTVFVNNFGVMRQNDQFTPHTNLAPPWDTHSPLVVIGSPTVFADGIPVARDGDPLSCGDVCDLGSTDVFADGGGGGGPAASQDPGETTGYGVSRPAIVYSQASYSVPYIVTYDPQRKPIFKNGCPFDTGIPDIYSPLTEEGSGRKFKNYPGPPLTSQSGAKLPPYATATARKPIPITGLDLIGTLPPGINFDRVTGRISGTITSLFNTITVKIIADNFVGKTTISLSFFPISKGTAC